jgi:hypothetical protein
MAVYGSAAASSLGAGTGILNTKFLVGIRPMPFWICREFAAILRKGMPRKRFATTLVISSEL